MKPISVLCIGDIHFKPTNVTETDAVHAATLSAIRTTETIDAVAVLGDILDRHDRIDIHSLRRAHHFFSDVRETLEAHHSTAKLIIIIGNHDLPNNQAFCSDAHAFNAMKRWPHTIVADRPVEFQIKRKKCLAVPYVPVGRFAEAVADFDLSSFSLVFAHQEFRGAKLSSHHVSTDGDVYAGETLCISGHLHEPCQVGHVWYPGSPFFHGWRDSRVEEARGLVLASIRGNTFAPTVIPIQTPSKIRLRFDSREDFNRALADMPAGSEVQAVIKGSRSDLKLIKQAIQSRGLSVTPVMEVGAPPVREEVRGTFREALAERLAVCDDLTVAAFVRNLFPNAGL